MHHRRCAYGGAQGGMESIFAIMLYAVDSTYSHLTVML